jgi:hypothetical protein
MLKPELARPQLEKLKSKQHGAARKARLKKLPKAIAAPGFGLYGCDADGTLGADWQKRVALQMAAVLQLSKDAKARARVWSALFPTLSKEVEAGWNVLTNLPYTVGYNRRAFRAPGREELYVSKRQQYIVPLLQVLDNFADDTLSAEWLATWAVHISGHSHEIGYLLAGVLDAGGETSDAILAILKDSAANRHEIGGPSGHATRALLCCSRPEAWEFMEQLLVAAQRQEGLRQSILEAVDEANLGAFRQMVGVVLDQNLIRFASVARAAGVWLGERQEVENPKKLKTDLQAIRDLLGDPDARRKSIAKGDGVAAYRALWAVACEDVEEALRLATPLFKDKDAVRRFAAAKFATESGLPEITKLMLPLLDDADLRVMSLGVSFVCQLAHLGNAEMLDDEDTIQAKPPANLFELIEKLIPKLPEERKELKPIAEGWFVSDLHREPAADALVHCLGKRPAEKLLPYLDMMGQYTRVQALAKLCAPRTLTNKVRQTLIAIAGETNRYVREAALGYLKKCKLAPDEVLTLEGYLSRKTADFRRSIFELLLNCNDKMTLGSIDRLLAAGEANSRAAGIELSRRMVAEERSAEVVREKLRTYREAKGKRLAAAEAEAIEIVLNPASAPPTLDDGLGTFDPSERTPPEAPKKRKVKFATKASVEFIRELDALIHEHRQRTYIDTRYTNNPQEKILGSITYNWDFPTPGQRPTLEEDAARLPLFEVWAEWWKNRPDSTRDDDGFEALRASLQLTERVREGEESSDSGIDYSALDDDFDDLDDSPVKEDPAVVAAREQINPYPPVKVRYQALIQALLPWFLRVFPVKGAADFVLDAAETALALIPPPVFERMPRADQEEMNFAYNDPNAPVEWREQSVFVRWFTLVPAAKRMPGSKTEHDVRLFRLNRWMDEPAPEVARRRPPIDIVLAAYKAGEATIADFGDHLIGPRANQRWQRESFSTLHVLTNPRDKASKMVDDHPELRDLVGRVVDRIVEIELARGETPTAASEAAGSIAVLHGSDRLLSLIAALGKQGFAKLGYGQSLNKPAVLTQMVQRCEPLPGETPEAFAAKAKEAIAAGRIDGERIIELGCVNPRWVTHVAATIGWPGYEEGVYWLIAHSRSAWGHHLEADEEDLNEAVAEGEAVASEKPDGGWQAILRQRTNLTAEQRAEGIIDVEWFHKAYEAVGSDRRWDALEASAKFLGYGQGHKKAVRLADVLLGRKKKKELVAEIRTKNLKESVKLLGLLPLPEDAAKKEAEMADRWKVLKEYERYARKLSALSKEPALRAARLGLENLAVTAGLSDPMRLEWTVTAREVSDLSQGPATVAVKNVTVALALTPHGDIAVTHSRDGKQLQSLPSEFRKHEKVAQLFERRKELTRIASNSKRSLEQAMCSGDRFRGSELKGLMAHAIVRPLIDRLVLKTDAGMGYPVKGGAALKSWDGKVISLKAADTWTIAHPLDFVAAGDWHEWQAECFRAERLQPFKQVFREVYTLTPAEKEDVDQSRRYSGQQVNENQAKALLASRGWSTREELSKLYREANLLVETSLEHGWLTPADAAAPQVRAVVFRRRSDWKRAPLAEVPPVIFSEVMRDMDLVVSVAHVGGVDPEASQSTVAMRADLLRETCTLLRLDNVKLDSRHALIQGEHGRYSVHLGSGVVHKQPGGSLCVVPVQAQHRGRLFLPFADDDPRTAEVISKVLLLARDKEIQDPSILQQIVGK